LLHIQSTRSVHRQFVDALAECEESDMVKRPREGEEEKRRGATPPPAEPAPETPVPGAIPQAAPEVGGIPPAEPPPPVDELVQRERADRAERAERERAAGAAEEGGAGEGEQAQPAAAPSKPKGEWQYQDPNSQEADAAVHQAAAEAFTSLQEAGKRSFADYVKIGRSIQRDFAQALLRTNGRKKGTLPHYEALARQRPYWNLIEGKDGAVLRSILRKVMANLTEIRAWLDSLPEWRRVRLNNPQHIYNRWLTETGRRKTRNAPKFKQSQMDAANQVVESINDLVGGDEKGAKAVAKLAYVLLNEGVEGEDYRIEG